MTNSCCRPAVRRGPSTSRSYILAGEPSPVPFRVQNTESQWREVRLSYSKLDSKFDSAAMTKLTRRRHPNSLTQRGGTLVFSVKEIRRLLFCSACAAPLQEHYYVHQCSSLPHALCFACLLHKGQCNRCRDYYTHFLAGGGDGCSQNV